MKKPLLFFLSLIFLGFCSASALAQSPSFISGRVLGYLSNRIGDYDGLRLRTGATEIHLFFPPHTAAKVRQLAGVGQLVTVDVEPGHGRPEHPRAGFGHPAEAVGSVVLAYRLNQVRNVRSGALLQLWNLPPPPPQSGRLVQTEGRLVGDRHDENGQLVALLTDKYLVELKPHQAEQISSLLEGVQRLGVAGYERTTDGFVNQTGLPVLHPTALTIRGQTFAL
ncbi:hypothetical protein [Fibrella forsythiae]|uniref:Uncharacterized protein n=1 Tax=Fibrella forsythiae TaxID=2817061 RepID=A0ABS3JGB2_9BACT|nr:hypothetical protein [Fibrella forsythiae]MBO0948466.1 hypothetical protein [Fibrella forsythiae]